jgi:hypothetical protein
MSENPIDETAAETGGNAGVGTEQAAAGAQPDGEGFGGPNSDADRVGPAGGDPHAEDRDPDDDAGMVSG